MLAEYMQEVPPWNGHQTKGSKNDLMYNWGLNRYMAGQPRTYSPILYDSSLASSSPVNCIQDKYNEHPKRRTTTDIFSYSDLIYIIVSPRDQICTKLHDEGKNRYRQKVVPPEPRSHRLVQYGSHLGTCPNIFRYCTVNCIITYIG